MCKQLEKIKLDLETLGQISKIANAGYISKIEAKLPIQISMKCVCNPGYAGNGVICGSDSDSDGFPDIGLNCNEPSFLMDNCPDFPNSGH